MALPTVTKTWQYEVNNTFGGQSTGAGQTQLEADAGHLLWLLKEALTGFATNPWTVVATSDSSSAALSDLLTSYQKFQWGGGAVARSWMLLRQAQIATNFEILIDCNDYDYNAFKVRCWVCVDGFDTTTISPTVLPVANSSRTWELELDETDRMRLGLKSVAPWSTGKIHVMMDTTGKLTRVFVCQYGIAKGFLLIDVPDDATVWTPGWTQPVVVCQRADQDLEKCNYDDLNDAVAGYGWFEGTFNNQFALYFTSEFYNGAAVGQQQTYPDDVSGEWSMCPIGLYCTTVGMRGPRRGSLTDIWWGSTAMKTGSTYPLLPVPTKEFAQFGDIIVPWNNTTPLVW